jgi:hypothetical protein
MSCWRHYLWPHSEVASSREWFGRGLICYGILCFSQISVMCDWIQSLWQISCNVYNRIPLSSQSHSPFCRIGTCVHLRIIKFLFLASLAKDKLHFFSDADTILQIHNTLKLLSTETSLLAPVLLSWALTTHRLFASLTGEGDEMPLPRSHVHTMVSPAQFRLIADKIV